MAQLHIRQYEDKDYGAVRDIFACGIIEHGPAGFRHLFRSPQINLLLLGLFLATFAASGSSLLSLAVVAAALAGSWVYLRSLWVEYVEQALASDMLDIRRAYLEAEDSCLWVAEAGGEVVGLVAAVPPQDPAERGSALELKRMSVAKQHRGRGISKVLTRTVIGFAQERGFRAVVLGTSMVQYAAQRLYEGMGFRKVAVIYPSRFARFLQFHVYYYRYEIPEL